MSYTLTLRNGNGIVKKVATPTIEAARYAWVIASNQKWVSWQIEGNGMNQAGYFSRQTSTEAAAYIASMENYIAEKEAAIEELEAQFEASDCPEDDEWAQQVGYGLLETLQEQIAIAQGEIADARLAV